MTAPDGGYFSLLMALRDEKIPQLARHVGWGDSGQHFSYRGVGKPSARGEEPKRPPISWTQLLAKLPAGFEFVRVSHDHQASWIAASDLPRLLAIPMRGGKIKHAAGRPCEVDLMHLTGGDHCDRVAVEPVERTKGWASREEKTTEWLCKVHLSHARRRASNAAEYQRQSEERHARYERERETSQRVKEAIERTRPVLEALGIHPDTVTSGSAGERIGVLIPAEVLELFAEQAVELEALKEDVGL